MASVRSTYDSLSRWYDLLAGSSERRAMEAGLGKLAVQEGERVVEVGCGTGNGLVQLAKSVGEHGRVCGLDLSAGMLAVARQKIEDTGLEGRVLLVRGNALSLPFRSACFAAAFMSLTLELFADREIRTVLQEYRRALRDNGRLGVVALSARGKPTLARALYERAHVAFPHYIDCRPIAVQPAVEAAGFATLDVAEMSLWGLPVEILVAERDT